MLKTIPLESESFSFAKLKKLIPGYELMLKTILAAILDRFERDKNYRFIDTKLNLLTGENFYPLKNDDPVYKGKEIIYSWIQGRGLEALAGHMEWIEDSDCFSPVDRESFRKRITNMLETVITATEENRAVNNGRMFFCMTQDGLALNIDNEGNLNHAKVLSNKSNFSDLFYSKGLFKAAWKLGKKELANKATDYFKIVIDDIINNKFHTDQQSFDHKNKVEYIPGKITQGPLMISLLGLAEIGRLETSEIWFDYAEKIITHITDFHINTGQYDSLEMYDFIEAVDADGKPWINGNGILCDPGHALEFVGLASKCLLLMRRHDKYKKLIERCKQLFPKVLLHAFELGFNEKESGICKAYDLKECKVLNSDMPWWSLPETMRAAIELLDLDPKTSFKQEIITVIAVSGHLK